MSKDSPNKNLDLITEEAYEKLLAKKKKGASDLNNHKERIVDAWTKFFVIADTSTTYTYAKVRSYISSFLDNKNRLPKVYGKIEGKTYNFDKARKHFAAGPESENSFIEHHQQNIKFNKSFKRKIKKYHNNKIHRHVKENRFFDHIKSRNNNPPNFNDLTFKGTLMDGPEIDIFNLSGLGLTDSEEDRILGFTKARDIIVEFLGWDEVELYEIDEIPGQSDSYYEYWCGDYDKFVKQLRVFMIQLLIDIDLDNTDHYY